LTQAGWKLEGVFAPREDRQTPLFLRVQSKGISNRNNQRGSTGKWFVSFSCDAVQPRVYPVTGQAIGIDVGIESFAVDSEGRIVDNPQFLKGSLAKLRVKQRMLCRRKRVLIEGASPVCGCSSPRKGFSSTQRLSSQGEQSLYQQFKYIAVEDLKDL